MTDVRRLLVTGAAGKVGQAFIGRLLASSDDRFAGFAVRALCHNRMLSAGPRLEVMTGSIEQRETVDQAVDGVTHVLHLATSKETPDTIMDVAIKGLAVAKAKDVDGLYQVGSDLDKACENCHLEYWYPDDKKNVQK